MNVGLFFTLPRKFGQAEIRGALCSGAIQHTIKLGMSRGLRETPMDSYKLKQ